MKRRAFLAGLLACAGCGSSSELSLSGPSTPDLDRVLDRAFEQVTAPGIIAGVKRGDQLWTAVRGSSEGGKSKPPGLDFHSRIGSITKTITATAILQLVKEALIGLDDPIANWFPGMPDGAQITVRMLGNMSSGIASFTEDADSILPYFADPYRVYDPNLLIANSLALPRLFTPGTHYHYSNTNFLMLGSILEQVRRQPIGQIFQERIFQPLSMTESSYPLTSDLPTPYWHGFTRQGSEEGRLTDSTFWSPTLFGASGQVVSNLADMLIWAKELGTGGLLTPAIQAERLQANPASTADGNSYLFGLAIQNGWLTHAGACPGFIADVAYRPDADISIAVLANSDVLLPIGQGSADFVSRELRMALS